MNYQEALAERNRLENMGYITRMDCAVMGRTDEESVWTVSIVF